jgi:hypothetical protein
MSDFLFLLICFLGVVAGIGLLILAEKLWDDKN